MSTLSEHTRLGDKLQAGLTQAGSAAVLLSVGLAIGAGFKAWLQPLNQSAVDNLLLGGYALAISLMVLIAWLGQVRWLFWLTGTAALVGLLGSLLQPGVAWAYLVTAAMLAVAGGLGAKLLNWLGPGLRLARAERLLFALLLGLGLEALITFALGMSGLLYPWLLAGFLVAGLLASGPELLHAGALAYRLFAGAPDRSWPSSNNMSWALGAGVGAIGAVGGLLWALAPAIHYDSLVYHLGVTTLYVRQHGILEVPEEFRSYWAHNAEMLYTLGLSLAGQPVPGLLHWTASTLAAGFVYLGGRRLAGVRTGLLAAALFFTMPMVTWLAGTTYVDLFPTVYVAAMLYAFYVWTQAENDAWLTLSGVVAGLAMSIKLTAGLELLPLSLSLLGAAVLRYGWSLRTLQVLLRFSLPVVILFAPWLIRDAVWTGNPVFPYLNGVFQSPDWPATNTLLNFSTYGRGHGLTDFLRLPWDLTFHTGDFAEGTPAGALGAVPILALPWLYLRPALTRRRLALVALYCLGVIVPWFFVAQYLRYLMPVLPVLSILAALNLAAAWGVLSSRLSERTGFWLALVLGGLLLLAGRASHLRSLWNIPERYPFGVVFGLERSSEFLSRALKYYDAFQFLNRQEPAGGKILAIGLSHRLYSDWRVHSLNTYDVLALTTSAAPGPVLAQALREFGTSYLVLDTDEIQRQPERWPPFASDERFLSQYAQLVFAGNGHEAYRLRPAPLDESASGPASLLVNGDFELEEPGGELAYWQAHGSPRYDRTGRAARHGNGAIELAGDDWYSQAVAVAADEVYSLGYWAQTDQPGALARLQINWRDAQSQQIDVSIVAVAPGAAWQWFEMSQTSPQGAVGAVIYVVAHGEAAIWFDDVTFVRGEFSPLPR